MKKDLIIKRKLFKWILPILSFYTLIILLKLTWLHILYFPEEIELFNQDYILLFASFFIFVLSLHYKLKISIIISSLSILIAIINILAPSIATLLLYRGMYLNKFI